MQPGVFFCWVISLVAVVIRGTKSLHASEITVWFQQVKTRTWHLCWKIRLQLDSTCFTISHTCFFPKLSNCHMWTPEFSQAKAQYRFSVPHHYSGSLPGPPGVEMNLEIFEHEYHLQINVKIYQLWIWKLLFHFPEFVSSVIPWVAQLHFQSCGWILPHYFITHKKLLIISSNLPHIAINHYISRSH